MSFYQYFFYYLVFGLFDHFFFIIFDIDCDNDDLFIVSVQKIENERKSCKMIEKSFCTVREFKLKSQSKLTCRECVLNLLEEQRKN